MTITETINRTEIEEQVRHDEPSSPKGRGRGRRWMAAAAVGAVLAGSAVVAALVITDDSDSSPSPAVTPAAVETGDSFEPLDRLAPGSDTFEPLDRLAPEADTFEPLERLRP